MNFITNRIKWLMIGSGLFTCFMLLAFVAPQEALNNFFGETVMSPHDEIVVRNWGFLIFMVGALLIYGAFSPPNRNLVLVIAIVSKCVFIGLILVYGGQFMDAFTPPLVLDSIMVALFILYLLLEPKPSSPNKHG